MDPPDLGAVSPKVFSEADLRRLLATCQGERNFTSRRDHALLRFLIDTGCRRGEVCSMQTGADFLNLRDRWALVDGKSRPRQVSFGAKATAAIDR